MKNHLLSALAISLITNYFALNTCKAQAPQGIPYQAIARNASGAAIANTAVKVRFSIRDSIATGSVRYQETHNPTTSALGLFSVNVGMGTVVSGSFSGINWGKNAKFLQVELDPAGGTSYTDLGTTQMMSVPYALYANSSFSISSKPIPIAQAFSNNSVWSCPLGVDSVEIEIFGASGGGGGGAFSLSSSGCIGNGRGGNGGHGGYIRKKVRVLQGENYEIVIGQGGFGGASSTTNFCYTPSLGGNGGDGGITRFGNLVIAEGGKGGQGGGCNYIAQNGVDGLVINFPVEISNFIPSAYPAQFSTYLYNTVNCPQPISGGEGNRGALGNGNCNGCFNCWPGSSGKTGLLVIRF